MAKEEESNRRTTSNPGQTSLLREGFELSSSRDEASSNPNSGRGPRLIENHLFRGLANQAPAWITVANKLMAYKLPPRRGAIGHTADSIKGPECLNLARPS